jgi:hypothetical protein
MHRPVPTWAPLSQDVPADQLGAYDRMRAACPVAESPRGVTLFRHADVVAAASDPVVFSSAASPRSGGRCLTATSGHTIGQKSRHASDRFQSTPAIG